MISHQSKWLRRAVSVTSVYLLVFQLIGTAIIATRMAIAGPDNAFALCSGHSSEDADGSGAIGDHGGHFACLVCAFAAFFTTLPDIAKVIAFILTAMGCLRLLSLRGAIASYWSDPRCSQGPPLTV